MAHQIERHDRGAIGYTATLGRTWHGIESYKQFEKTIPMVEAEAVLDWTVSKRPMQRIDDSGKAREVPGTFCLVRDDLDIVLWPSVGNNYTPLQNMDVLESIRVNVMEAWNIDIESIGTLVNGREIFMNFLVHESTIDGDISPTSTRLLFTNSHGDKAIKTCMTQTRVVCMNTLRFALRQGKQNGSLFSIRHTITAQDRVADKMMDFADLVAEARENEDALNKLANIGMTDPQAIDFVDELIPPIDMIGNKKTRGGTIAEGKAAAILKTYYEKPDLKAIGKTRYRMLNAVTDWADHQLNTSRKDAGGNFMDSVYGTKDEIKQKALKLLIA